MRVWLVRRMAGVVRRISVLAAMVAVVGLMVWAGVRNLRARRAAMAQNEIVLVKADSGAGTATVSGTGAAAVQVPDQGIKGKVAPAFTLVDVAGKKVSLAEFKGRPVVINFWATYCGPCRLEMPWFQEFAGKYKDQGLVVLGVDQDDDMAAADVASAAKKIGVTYPILMQDRKMEKAYMLGDYLPETFYVDKAGVVVEHTQGTPSKDELEANLKKALGGI